MAERFPGWLRGAIGGRWSELEGGAGAAPLLAVAGGRRVWRERNINALGGGRDSLFSHNAQEQQQ